MSSYKVIDTIKWFENFDNKELSINTKSKNFYVKLHNTMLPHLLGLHYMYNGNKKASEIYDEVKFKIFSDEKILSKVATAQDNKIYRIEQVRDRINNFKTFMENIDKGFLVENSRINDKRYKIRSQYFVVKENSKNDYLLLGIKKIGEMQKVFSFEKMAMETFIESYGTAYFKDSNIKEPIEELMFFDDELDMWRDGSFDLEKDKILEDTFYENQFIKNQILEDFKSEYANHIIEYENFHFVPLRTFTEKEKNMSLNEITKYLEADSFMKKEIGSADEFYKKVDVKEDLFYNIETGNVYIPATAGMFKYKGIEEDEVLELLNKKSIENDIDNILEESPRKETISRKIIDSFERYNLIENDGKYYLLNREHFCKDLPKEISYQFILENDLLDECIYYVDSDDLFNNVYMWAIEDIEDLGVYDEQGNWNFYLKENEVEYIELCKELDKTYEIQESFELDESEKVSLQEIYDKRLREEKEEVEELEEEHHHIENSKEKNSYLESEDDEEFELD